MILIYVVLAKLDIKGPSLFTNIPLAILGAKGMIRSIIVFTIAIGSLDESNLTFSVSRFVVESIITGTNPYGI